MKKFITSKLTGTDLKQMDKEADKVIAGWSFGSLVGNLLPPPFDIVAVSSAFAKMGYELSKVYKISISMDELTRIGKVIAKGISAYSGAVYIGSNLLKWIPGVNIWVALLMQPPLVAAIAYSAGHTFKEYYHFKISKGKDLTDVELRKITEKALKSKVAA